MNIILKMNSILFAREFANSKENKPVSLTNFFAAKNHISLEACIINSYREKKILLKLASYNEYLGISIL